MARNLSQEKLAHLCRLHATFVGAVERGEKSVTLENLDRLAGGLGITPWELVRLATTGELLGAGPAGLRFSVVAERTAVGYSAYCPNRGVRFPSRRASPP